MDNRKPAPTTSLPVATSTLAVSAKVTTGSMGSRAVSRANARRRNKLVQYSCACQPRKPCCKQEALMERPTETIDQAQKICKMYVFLNKDFDPSYVSAWKSGWKSAWDPVLTDHWYHSGSVTLASTLPPCVSSTTGAVVASTTGGSTLDTTVVVSTSTTDTSTATTAIVVASTTESSATASSATTTGSTVSRQTQTASRSMTSLRSHSCLFHLFTYSIRPAHRFDHYPRASYKFRRLLPWL